jgi:hypothetical protein
MGFGLSAAFCFFLISSTYVYSEEHSGYDPETETYLKDRVAEEKPMEKSSQEALEDEYEASLVLSAINPSGNYFNGDGGFSGDFCVGCADNENPDREIDIQDSSTVLIRFDDTGVAISTWDIGIPSESHRFIIKDVLNDVTPFVVKENAENNTLVIDGAVAGIGTTNPEDVVGGTSRSSLFIEANINPSLILNQAGSSARTWMIFPSALDGGLLFGDAETNNYSMVIEDNGNVGIGTSSADYKLEVNGTIHASSIEVASSRECKENIESLNAREAEAILHGLDPVGFNYKEEPQKRRLGFIAEDVPDLVATKDRKGVTSMDIVAVLTSVVKQQQKTMSELVDKVAELENALKQRPSRAGFLDKWPLAMEK